MGVSRTRQTEQDTEKAKSRLSDSRVVRSGEYQRRVDAANRVDQVGTPQGNVDFTASTTTASAGGGGLVSPFQIVQIDFETIGIRKGTVSTIVPTIGGTPLDDDYTQNTFTVGGATTFWLNATVNSSEVVTAVAIVTSDPGADTDTQSKQTLGSLTWDNGAIDAISSNLGGSQNVDSCGASHSWNRI